jgi:hypothetical protein
LCFTILHSFPNVFAGFCIVFYGVACMHACMFYSICSQICFHFKCRRRETREKDRGREGGGGVTDREGSLNYEHRRKCKMRGPNLGLKEGGFCTCRGGGELLIPP